MNLRSLIEDNTGGASSMRVLMLGAFLAVGAVWCFVAVSTKSIPDLPPGVVTVLGAVVAAKTAQRFGEKDPQ